MTPSDLQQFQALSKSLRIGIHYSPIAVLELIKGMKLKEHYEVCQDEIRMADRITNKHILEDPWSHVKRSAALFLGRGVDNFDTRFLNLCRNIATLPYKEMKSRIWSIRDSIVRWETDWVNDLKSIKSSFREHFGFDEGNRGVVEKVRSIWETQHIQKRKQTHWIAFCEQHSLPGELKNLPLRLACSDFHSFRYSVDCRVTYENKLLFEDKEPKRGDYLDWLQTVYLNIMDYLVTNDRKLVTVFNECANKEMHGVAISFDKFYDCCMRRTLPRKRAPDMLREKWHDLR